ARDRLSVGDSQASIPEDRRAGSHSSGCAAKVCSRRPPRTNRGLMVRFWYISSPTSRRAREARPPVRAFAQRGALSSSLGSLRGGFGARWDGRRCLSGGGAGLHTATAFQYSLARSYL